MTKLQKELQAVVSRFNSIVEDKGKSIRVGGEYNRIVINEYKGNICMRQLNSLATTRQAIEYVYSLIKGATF